MPRGFGFTRIRRIDVGQYVSPGTMLVTLQQLDPIYVDFSLPEQTVTAGIISKKDRNTTNSSFQRFLQTDAAINRGNSGGPLVNMRGEAIGVNSQIATLTGDYNGIGFALPANEAKFVAEQILGRGRVQRGFLGVNLESVRAELARVYHLPDAKGAIVADLQPERNGQPTPAAKAGLQLNDIITEFNGQAVQDSNDLIALPYSWAPPLPYWWAWRSARSMR